MAGFTGIIKTLADLTAQTTAADTDVMPIGTTSPKKITIANLKEELGINALNRNLNTRQLKTYTELSQIGLTDANTLQELCNVLPEKSILLVEIGAKPGSGWKSQLPEGMGLIRIEKYYLSRVNILFYPMNGGYFFQGAFSNGASPNLRPFVKYTGVAI